MRRPRTLPAAVALATLLLAACGDDDEPTAGDPTSPPAVTTIPVVTAPPTAAGSAGGGDGETPPVGDACVLLTPEEIAAVVGGGTWNEGLDPGDGTCSWVSGDGSTISVAVERGREAVFAGIVPTDAVTVEELPVGASTAVARRDVATGALTTLSVPAGADDVVTVVVVPPALEDAWVVSIGETAAIALENAPATPSEGPPATAGDMESTVEVTSVRFTVQSSDAGLDLEFEVTADEVAAAANPIATLVLCTGIDPASTALQDDVYSVSAIDIDRSPGLVNASLVTNEDVTGPGSYEASFSASDSAGRSVDLDGSVTIDDGLRSGEFLGEDGAGNQVVVTYECRPLG
jgi:hypothetical protein